MKAAGLFFSEEPAFPRRAGFQISEVWMACIIRSMIIRPNRFFHILFLCGNRKNSSGFTATRCFRWMLNRMRRTENWRNGKKTVNCPESLRRILMACIRKREIRKFMSFMEAFTEITVNTAGSFIRLSISGIIPARFRNVNAAEESNRMWFCMKKAWIMML